MGISKKVAVLFGVLGLTAGTLGTIAMQTQASNTANTNTRSGLFNRGEMPAAAGSVTAVSGNTITVTDKRSGTSYTVDASSATIEKITLPTDGTKPTTKPQPTTISVSDIKVGDNVRVEGTVNGTNITATQIMDGVGMFRGGMEGRGGPHGAFGTVSAVNGNTITLADKNGKTYTVEAANASVKKVVDSSVSGIAVGDTLRVNGTVSDTTITATTIVDGALGMGR